MVLVEIICELLEALDERTGHLLLATFIAIEDALCHVVSNGALDKVIKEVRIVHFRSQSLSG